MVGFCTRLFPLCLLLWAGGGSGPVHAGDLDGLLQNSPFGRSTANPRPTSAEPLEFRGLMVEDGIHYFSVRETATARSFWVTLFDHGASNFVANDYDEANQRLTVDYQGNQLVLTLVKPDNLVAPPVTAANPPRPPVAAATPPAPTSSPEAEAERLRNIAEEIKRRRALRQQAINNTPPIPQP